MKIGRAAWRADVCCSDLLLGEATTEETGLANIVPLPAGPGEKPSVLIGEQQVAAEGHENRKSRVEGRRVLFRSATGRSDDRRNRPGEHCPAARRPGRKAVGVDSRAAGCRRSA